MKKIIYILSLGLILASCDKTEEYTPSGVVVENGAENLDDIVIPTPFNWSSSSKGGINVALNANSNLVTNGAPILLLDSDKNIIDRSVIFNNEAGFYHMIPQNNSEVSIFYPNTNESFLVTGSGNITFPIGQLDRTVERDSTYVFGKKGKKSSNKALVNVLINGDFTSSDLGTDFSGYSTLRTAGKWYEGSSYGELSTQNGSQVYKSTQNSNNKWGVIVQSVTSGSNESYTASFDYSGNSSHVDGYLDFFNSNGSHIGTDYFSPSSGSATVSGTTPNNTAYVQVYISQKKKGYIDNVILDMVPAVVDSDNDGVPDDTDDYPNDITRAYTSYFPSSGFQTLSFEDLWPAKGDFDFNDMVISNNVVYTLDANSNKVDATFTISLDAAGSGLSNGLAIVFRDGSNNQNLTQNIIASVSGGNVVQDPNVINGIIVFDDVFAAQSIYYQNNGLETYVTPDVFTFTVTFNSNAGTQAIVPDTYIYRTDDRAQEVHLDGFSGTTAANSAYFNTIDDVNGTYNTSSGLPWVLEVVTANKSYKHPKEKVDIVLAYPQFQQWAQSDGAQNTDWLDHPTLSEIVQ